jgi:hypothetical protein
MKSQESLTMKSFIVALVLAVCSFQAHADSNYTAILLGPAWHASSHHYNWKTFGIGISKTWNDNSSQTSFGLGAYHNSDYDYSVYVAGQELYQINNSNLLVGFTAGLVNGYPITTTTFYKTCNVIEQQTKCNEYSTSYNHGSGRILPLASLNFGYKIDKNTILTINVVPKVANHPLVVQMQLQVSY